MRGAAKPFFGGVGTPTIRSQQRSSTSLIWSVLPAVLGFLSSALLCAMITPKTFDVVGVGRVETLEVTTTIEALDVDGEQRTLLIQGFPASF